MSYYYDLFFFFECFAHRTSGTASAKLQAASQSSKQSVPFCPVYTAIVGVMEPKKEL